MWKECESYKHKCAKEIVKGWIDSELEIPTNYESDFGRVYNLGSDRRNRDEVWLEYPVGYYKENDYNVCQDNQGLMFPEPSIMLLGEE